LNYALKNIYLFAFFTGFFVFNPQGATADNNAGTVTLAAVGDVFFARGVDARIQEFGTEYPFAFLGDEISKYDISFCNLECALSDRGEARVKRFLFRADRSSASILSDSGFDVICLANNHSLDYGPEALLDTVDAITDAGLVEVGTQISGQNDSGAVFIVKNALKIGILAFSDFDNFEEETPPGFPYVMRANHETIPDQVSGTKQNCDVLIVSMHWGIDFVDFPTERQEYLAWLCAANGADLILGHHPHVLQDVKYTGDVPVVYSMGGFLWDATSRGSDKSAIYIFELSKDHAELIDLVPIKIVNCRPVPDFSL